MTRLAFALALAATSLSAAQEARSPQPQLPAATLQDPHEPGPSPAGKPPVSAEDQEILELIRLAIMERDLDGARELLREVASALEEPRSGAEEARLAFLLELDRLAAELGLLQLCSNLRGDILELHGRMLPPDHFEILNAKLNLAATCSEIGDFARARELQQGVLAAGLAPEHPLVVRAKGDLAITLAQSGDLRNARALQEEVLLVLSRSLPAEDEDLLTAKLNLASTRARLGELNEARALFSELLAAWGRTRPRDHPDVLLVKNNLAGVLVELDEPASARALLEEVLAAQIRSLPPTHPELSRTKVNLASSLYKLGELESARRLQEEVLVQMATALPPEHEYVIMAKANLAHTKRKLGDIAGAQELFQEALESLSHGREPDSIALLEAKKNVAMMKMHRSDFSGALELFEEVLAAQLRRLPPEHPFVVGTKHNLAGVYAELGDLPRARRLLEGVLEARAPAISPQDLSLLLTKENLALILREQGEFTRALELLQETHAFRTRLLPHDHPDLLRTRLALLELRLRIGERDALRDELGRLLDGMRTRAQSLQSDSARAARESARIELEGLAKALAISEASDPDGALSSNLFATLESLRDASVTVADVARAALDRPALADRMRAIGALRARLNDLAAGGPATELAVESWRQELLGLASERDQKERELRSMLAESGVLHVSIEGDTLGARLEPGAVAVSFLRYSRGLPTDPETGRSLQGVDSLLAFLALPGGRVRRIDLGPTAPLEGLVSEWRAALGRALEDRGLPGDESSGETKKLEELGRHLREQILDPVLANAGAARTLHVVLDDVLHLVPLDALPLETGLVGDRIAVRNEISLARLLRTRTEDTAEGTLTAVGGIDYDAELDADALVRLDALNPPLEAGTVRSGPGVSGFSFLPGTAAEAASIAVLYRGAFGREPGVLDKAAATKAALHATAPKTRFLHLATHGWFAPETFKSQLDSLSEGGARECWLRAESTLAGFAPETLCGLALAGANRGRDAAGRVPGILTAEELATFDLRNCELAVLSACETNVGIRRAGQGIQSLQSALHAAGARTAITSLWRVDDAATRRLFELFYTKLWKERIGKAEALWQAKMALRAEGHPLRDWAGWVLSGDPN